MLAEHSGIISLSISEPMWRAWDSKAPGTGVTVVPSLSPSIAEWSESCRRGRGTGPNDS